MAKRAVVIQKPTILSTRFCLKGLIYPKNIQDHPINWLPCQIKKNFKILLLSPRGGGTGTNGQSLTEWLV